MYEFGMLFAGIGATLILFALAFVSTLAGVIITVSIGLTVGSFFDPQQSPQAAEPARK